MSVILTKRWFPQFVGLFLLYLFLVYRIIDAVFYFYEEYRYDSSVFYIQNVSASFESYHQTLRCTYDTPIYVIQERGDLSHFILNSYFTVWTFFRQYMDDPANRTVVVFHPATPFFTASACQYMDLSKFTNRRNDFHHPLYELKVPSWSQAKESFRHFVQPMNVLGEEQGEFDVGLHLMKHDPVTFLHQTLPLISHEINMTDPSLFVTTGSFRVLQAVQTVYRNVTSFNFNRKKWSTKRKPPAEMHYIDYLQDMESLAKSKRLIGKCSSRFFLISLLLYEDKPYYCLDSCKEENLWIHNDC